MQAQIQRLHAEASVELGSLRALRPRSAYSPYVPQPEAAAPLEEQPRAEAEEPWHAVDDETRVRELCGQLRDATARLHNRGPPAPSELSPHAPGSMEERVWRINREDAERRRLGELSSLAHSALQSVADLQPPARSQSERADSAPSSSGPKALLKRL